MEYAVKVFFSLIALGIGVVGMFGYFGDAFRCWASSVVMLVLGLWVAAPKIKRSRSSKHRKYDLPQYIEPLTQVVISPPSDNVNPSAGLTPLTRTPSGNNNIARPNPMLKTPSTFPLMESRLDTTIDDSSGSDMD